MCLFGVWCRVLRGKNVALCNHTAGHDNDNAPAFKTLYGKKSRKLKFIVEQEVKMSSNLLRKSTLVFVRYGRSVQKSHPFAYVECDLGTLHNPMEPMKHLPEIEPTTLAA